MRIWTVNQLMGTLLIFSSFLKVKTQLRLSHTQTSKYRYTLYILKLKELVLGPWCRMQILSLQQWHPMGTLLEVQTAPLLILLAMPWKAWRMQ